MLSVKKSGQHARRIWGPSKLELSTQKPHLQAGLKFACSVREMARGIKETDFQKQYKDVKNVIFIFMSK